METKVFLKNKISIIFSIRFVPGDSTINQLLDICNTFCKAPDDGKGVRAVFCDVSKAYSSKGIQFTKVNRLPPNPFCIKLVTIHLSACNFAIV